ncbi:UNVERIFIED_ORG: hypothetical protein ABIC97_002650 [Peribacillus simplex]
MKKGLLFLLISALTLGGVFLWHFLKTDQATLKKYYEYVKRFSEQNYDEMLHLISEEKLEEYDYTKKSF